MKKIMFICFIILTAITGINAQKRDTTITNSHKVATDLLFQTAKKQQATGWLLLGTGIALGMTGSAIIANDIKKDAEAPIISAGMWFVTREKRKHSAAGPILSLAGTGAVLVSIPYFIASGRNKRKANLMVKNEIVYFNPRVSKQQVLSAGIKINL